LSNSKPLKNGPLDIAETITSTPGIIHGIEIKNNLYAVAYFYN